MKWPTRRTDEPTPVAVRGASATAGAALRRSPGAAIRVAWVGESGAIGRLLVTLARRGTPVELVAAEPEGVWVDGREAQPDELRGRLT
jgi:hypothetical protein